MSVIALLALGLLIALVLLTGQTAWTLTHPPRRGYTWAVSRGVPGTPAELPGAPDGPGPRAFTPFAFRSRDRDLPAWDIPGDRAGGPVIIFTPGWGESRLHGLARLGTLLPRAARIILWDLPGHGDAPGWLSMGTGEVDDLLALMATINAAPGRVVLHGFSLGAGISIAAAARNPSGRIRSVIAEAPYRFPQTPALRVMRGAGLPAWPSVPLALGLLGLFRFGQGLSWFGEHTARAFDRAALAARCPAPLLVIHGSDDAICPIDDGRAIARAAPRARLIEISLAAHLNLWADEPFRSRCDAAIGAFLAEQPAPAAQSVQSA